MGRYAAHREDTVILPRHGSQLGLTAPLHVVETPPVVLRECLSGPERLIQAVGENIVAPGEIRIIAGLPPIPRKGGGYQVIQSLVVVQPAAAADNSDKPARRLGALGNIGI